MLMAFALAWLIPYFIGLRAYVLVAWVPFYLLAGLLVPNIAKVTVPPKLEEAESVTRRSLLRRNVGLFVSLWTYWVFFIFLNGVLSAAIEGKHAFFGYLWGRWVGSTQRLLWGQKRRSFVFLQLFSPTLLFARFAFFL